MLRKICKLITEKLEKDDVELYQVINVFKFIKGDSYECIQWKNCKGKRGGNRVDCGEFYSPTFLALEAIDYYEEGDYEAACNILDLIQQCVDKDYNNMPGKRLAEILHMGMIMDSKREYQVEITKFENRIKRLENGF